MNLVPPNDSIESLATVFDKYSKINFPSLREQFDESFDRRYKEFWENKQGVQQLRLWSVLEQPVNPSPTRIEFDLAVCEALGISITKDDLLQLYEVLIKEMVLIRGLTKD